MTAGEMIRALKKVDEDLEVYIGENMESGEPAIWISEVKNLNDTGCAPYVIITTR